VEYRRRELEKFLKRTVEHPLLCFSSHLQTFLEGPELQLTESKTTQQPPGLADKFANFFGMKIQTSLSPPIEVDPWFQSKIRYVNALETQVNMLAGNYNNLLIKENEMASLHTSIANATVLLSNGELESDKQLAGNLAGLAELHKNIQQLNNELAQQTKINFLDTLRDYSRMISSAKDMLSYRNERLGFYQEVLVNAKNKRERIEKVRAQNNNISPAALESELHNIEVQVQKEKESFEAISKNCRAELERLEVAKTKEFQDAVMLLVQTNINYELRVANLWKSYLAKVTTE